MHCRCGCSRQDVRGKAADPAAQAGIQPDARGVQRNRRVVVGRRFALDPGNLDHPALVTVERAEQRIDLKPVNTVITGVPDRYDPSKRVAAGFFGVEPEVVRQRGGPIAVVGDMWQMTKQLL